MDEDRRMVAALFKRSFLRQKPFRSIASLAFPDYCRSVGRFEGGFDLEFCRILYLESVANIYNYKSQSRRQRLKSIKNEALQNRIDTYPRERVGDPVSDKYRKPCGDATRALQKTFFKRGEWKRKRGGIFETSTRTGTLACRFDLGTWRGSLVLDILFPDIKVRFPVDLFFWLDLRTAFTFQEPELFKRNLEEIVDLVGILKRSMEDAHSLED